MADDPELTAEIEGKLQLFYRVLMSYVDFQHAVSIASIILNDNLHAGYPRENRILLQALNAAMVVAYCRPFSGNDPGPDRIRDLPGRFLRVLTPEERELHDAVMADRNQVVAHADPEAWNLRPHYVDTGSSRILIPLHHDIHAPFLREPTEMLSGMAVKLMEAVFEERQRLEQEIGKYLPAVDQRSAE